MRARSATPIPNPHGWFGCAERSGELTGLYNRRGFLVLAQGHLALAQRHKRGVALIFADVDELKHVNDEHGHTAGDRALIAAARILRQTYRSADVVARLGGDEFAVFPLEVSDQTTIPRLVARLEQHLADHNAQSGEPFKLSMSLGVGHYRPARPSACSAMCSTRSA